MYRNRFATMLGCALVAALATPPMAGAQDSSSESATQLDPDAVSALDKMGAALRSLDHFSLTSDSSVELVLDSGQKVELDTQVRYKVQRPDKIFVEIDSDRRQRQLFYDGHKFSIYAPRLKYYANAEIEGKTLGELVLGAAHKYGIEFPLTDLFFWGTDEMIDPGMTAAFRVGGGKIDNEEVDQYAYRQPGVDWQIWISKETRLPKKLIITSLDDDARPQYQAQLHWDTRTVPARTVFDFSPPQDAVGISLVPDASVALQDQEEQ